jgi:hypothetical protein
MLAIDLFIYIDDLRPTGPDAKECWRNARKGDLLVTTWASRILLGKGGRPQGHRDPG